MAKKRENNEFKAFDALMDNILKVPREEVKSKLDKEKKEKRKTVGDKSRRTGGKS